MLSRYRPKQRITDEDGADLAALPKGNSEYKEKVGVGIAHFDLMSAEIGTQCFRLVRVYGTGDDFPYPHCIAGRPGG